jgi:serine/threonine protein kinase
LAHLTPRRIGRYEIVKELGRGTMGVVYEARDPVLDRRIALKTIHLSHLAADQRRRVYERRFLAEAQAAGQLSHPGIVVVHDVGRDSETDLLYIALEFLVGRTLAELIAENALPEWRECLRIMAQVARALHHAHKNGVVHRDVKPANIMILPSGEPKIMDFGIAKLDTSELTSPGELFGTPLYMAPEQALGEKVDARSDLFSLGSIAYTILTGRPPFTASSVPGILARVAHQEPPRPTETAPGLPKSVDYFVARAMAKSPDERYPDGQKMAEDIEDIVAGKSPRHRRGWVMPDRGAGTIYIQRQAGETPEVSLEFQPVGAESSKTL